jgi:hypothetical protein
MTVTLKVLLCFSLMKFCFNDYNFFRHMILWYWGSLFLQVPYGVVFTEIWYHPQFSFTFTGPEINGGLCFMRGSHLAVEFISFCYPALGLSEHEACYTCSYWTRSSYHCGKGETATFLHLSIVFVTGSYLESFWKYTSPHEVTKSNSWTS